MTLVPALRNQFAVRRILMGRTFTVPVAMLLVLAAWPGSAQAEVFIRVPFFSFAVGPRPCAAVPAVSVFLPPWLELQVRPGMRRRARVQPVSQPPAREEIPPQYDEVQPPPPEPSTRVARVPTVAEFATSFKPLPGAYEAVLIHPVSRAPVKVRFTLPDGPPRKVRVRRRELVFDYGRHRVKVRFIRDGSVRIITR
jgi:hypothetical protein